MLTNTIFSILQRNLYFDWHNCFLKISTFLQENIICINVPKYYSIVSRKPDPCTTRQDGMECKSQFLTMVTQLKHQFFFFHNMQNKFCTRHIPHIVHEPWQPLQICMNSIIWGWPWSFTTNICLIIHFRLQPNYFMIHPLPFFLSLMFNILTEMPVASSSKDVWQPHMNSRIFRLHFKNSSRNTFYFSTLPWILQAPSKAIHAATCGFQGIAMTIFSACWRWPTWPRRLTIQV